MSKLKGFNWLCALVLVAGAANADVIIDNQAIPSADINSISISPANGHLFVTTIPGYSVTPNVAGTSVAITNFIVNPSTVVAGGSATVSWNTANAVSCSATGGTGGWSGSAIALPSGSKSITASTAGTYTFTLTCNGATAGDTKTANYSLVVNPANAVVITSFIATPASITAGESVTLNWTTANATSCTPSGGTGGWNTYNISLPNGSVSIPIATAGSYTFSLTCKDASAGTATRSTVVVVNPATQQCSASPLAGQIVQWKDFWLVDWPKPTYDNRYATIPLTGYYALEFNTGNIVSKGKLYTIETTVTDGVRFGAISQCPGDFNVADECDYMWGISGGISWSTDGSTGCQLAPNTTYYFNVTFTDGTNPASSTCSSSPCITKIQNYNR
jgi:hypothetical protein